MENTLTAKELFDKMVNENDEITSTDMMIEFAKLHVEQALKAASESRCINMYDKTWFAQSLEPGTKILDRVNITVDKDSILNSYLLTNIK
jgi:hypothetical protein